MHYELVDGYPMPARFAGHPALELCNTWAGWEVPPTSGAVVDRRREYLVDFDRLAVWTGHVGLLDAAEVASLRSVGADQPDAARRALRDVRRLRVALYRAALHADPDAFETVARYADRAAHASRLVRDGQGSAVRTVDATAGLGVLRVSQAAEQLLADPGARSVRACPGNDCGWLFIDSSGRRRWCSMSNCGNRAKVRAHAARNG